VKNGYVMMKTHNISNVSFSIIAGIVICVAFLNRPLVSSGMDQVEQNTGITETKHSKTPFVHLYFSDKDNSFLKAETRDLLHSDDPSEFGKNIVKALIKGPRTGLMRTIPVDTTLKAFYITKDGTAYVDLSDTIRDTHPGGVKSELFTIYSIVNSLTLNIPEIDTVKILISGKEAMTLNGHIDVRFPFKANMLLIR
jgi:spore germination protein GerM